MTAILTLLCVLTLSMLLTRTATVALSHTGLSHESAKFQARSAFTGVGFTTNESEKVVNHPVRRRILMMLMIVGNAGIVTTMSTVILTFTAFDDSGGVTKFGVLALGLAALWLVASSEWVDRRLSRLISRALRESSTLEIRDYDSLLHLSGEYRVTELFVHGRDWIAGRSLADSGLRDEGVTALGITRQDGSYVGTPDGDTVVNAGDVLVLYGRTPTLQKLDNRRRGRSGDAEHQAAVREQAQIDEHEAEFAASA